MKMKKILFVALSLMLLLAFGCSKDTNNSSVTNPRGGSVNPVGYIQGRVVDACTGEGIQNAWVDIGLVSKVKTNEDGVYKMKNVPATTYIDKTTVRINGDLDIDTGESSGVDVDGRVKATVNSGWYGNYTAVVNMANATIGGVPVTNYASTYTTKVEVVFGTAAETESISGSGSNGDTTIDQIASGGQDIFIGKMNTKISGNVIYASNILAPAANFIVYVFSNDNGSDYNSGTGFGGNKVAQVTTGADGSFSVSGLEANQRFDIFVVDGAGKYEGSISRFTGCNGAELPFQTIKVSSTDELCPFIASTSPVMYTDVSGNTGAAGLNVVITFSESIMATPYNTGKALTASPYFPGLYDDVAVNYLGNKIGNIQHTFWWGEVNGVAVADAAAYAVLDAAGIATGSTLNKLTITIPTEAVAPAAIYSVVIMNNRYLSDLNGNLLSGKPDSEGTVTCLSSSDFVSAYASTWGLIATTFSTYGALEAGAIADLKVKSPELLDYNDVPVLDWTNDTGAKSYNVYCQMMQWPIYTNCDVCDPDHCTTTGGQLHPYMLIQSGDLTGGPLYGLYWLWNNFFGTDNYLGPFGGDFVFVEDWGIKLSYHCYVRGVNADGVEGPASNTVTIEDTVAPTAYYPADGYTEGAIPADTAPAPPIPVVTSITVCFSEPMNEKLVETIGNWTLDSAAWTTYDGTVSDIAVPMITNIDYLNLTNCATISLGVTATGQVGGIPDCTYTKNPPIGCPFAGITPNFASTLGGLQDVSGNKLVKKIIDESP